MATYITFFGLLAKRFGIPEVLGEVFAGIVLGPSIFGLIPLNEAIKILAEIGIILLLFQVGLEVDFPNLIKVGWWALFVALFGAFVPFLGGFFLSHYWFGLDLVGSLFIGGALTATSIGITVKVLSDLGQNNKPFAQIVLGAAVIDDILGVIFLTALYEFAKYKTLQLDATLQLSFFIVFFLLIAPIVAQIFAKALFWLIKKSKEDSAIAPFIMGLILEVLMVNSCKGFSYNRPNTQVSGSQAGGLPCPTVRNSFHFGFIYRRFSVVAEIYYSLCCCPKVGAGAPPKGRTSS